jgi:hypothetical protein
MISNVSEWRQYVESDVTWWQLMALYWMQDRAQHVLVYEWLLDNKFLELYKVVKFLNYNVTFSSLHCLSNNMSNIYKRVKPKWMTKEKLLN